MASNDVDPRRPQSGLAPGLRRIYGGRTLYPTDLGPAPLAGSTPASLVPQGGLVIRLPGSSFAPDGSIPVDQTGDGDIAPSSSATLVTIVTPDALRFRIAGIGFGADDEVALGALSWSMLINGDPSTGYSTVPAAIGSIRQLAAINVITFASQVVTIVARTSAALGGTFRFICRVQGWFYTEDRS